MPSSTQSRPFPRTPGILAFTIALREVRKEHGLGVRALAHKLGISASSISSFETERLPPHDMIGRILGILSVSRPVHEQLIALAQRAPSPTFVEYRADGKTPLTSIYELNAITITEWAPRLIPELVRAPSYVRALLSRRIEDPRVLDQQMFAHLTKANVLASEAAGPGRYILLLSTAALRPADVSASDMLEQLYLLRSVSKQSKVDIRLVPESACLPDLLGARVVYNVSKDRSVAILPQQDTTIYLSSASDVAHHQATLESLIEKALSKEETLGAIAATIDEIEAALPAACRTDEAALIAPSFASLEGPLSWPPPPVEREKSAG